MVASSILSIGVFVRTPSPTKNQGIQMNLNMTMSDAHAAALSGTVALSMESRLDFNAIKANLLQLLPNVKNYMTEVLLQYKSVDESDFNFQKASLYFGQAEAAISEMNMVKLGHFPVQVPEGFTGRYLPYLEWINTNGLRYVTEAHSILESYYMELSAFVSSRDQKLVGKDSTRAYAVMERRLQDAKKDLASFFEPGSSNALQPLEKVFSRAIDIKECMKVVKDVNRVRTSIKNKDILGLVKQISDLLTIVGEQASKKDESPISSQVVNSIAQGALVAAHFVEFVGVLRYRIEEAVSCTCIVTEQVTAIVKEHA